MIDPAVPAAFDAERAARRNYRLSIWNGVLFNVGETYTFTAGDQTKLAGALPGPDRGGAPQTYGLEDAFGPRGGGALGFEKIQCGACRARARR